MTWPSSIESRTTGRVRRRAWASSTTCRAPAGRSSARPVRPARSTAPGSVLTCSGITLADPGSYSVVVRKTTTPADCGTLPNTVTVIGENEPEGETENNTDDATITVECPDVVVSKEGNGTINAGEVAEFTIVITNNGPGEATGVSLNDDLPGAGWAIDDQTGDACDVDATGSVLTCSGITLGVEDEYEIVVSKTTTPANCGTLPNLVTVDAENEAAGRLGEQLRPTRRSRSTARTSS